MEGRCSCVWWPALAAAAVVTAVVREGGSNLVDCVPTKDALLLLLTTCLGNEVLDQRCRGPLSPQGRNLRARGR